MWTQTSGKFRAGQDYLPIEYYNERFADAASPFHNRGVNYMAQQQKKKIRLNYFRTKSKQDLADLVEDCQVFVWHFIKKYHIIQDKEDYAQFLNVLVMESVNKFNPSFDVKFTTFLYRLLEMGLWAKLKGEKSRRKYKTTHLPTDNRSMFEDKLRGLKREELVNVIYQILGNHSDTAQVIIEHYLNQKTYKEICKETGMSIQRASVLSQRGCDILSDSRIIRKIY